MTSNTTGTIVPGAISGVFVGELRIAASGSVIDRLGQPHATFGDYAGSIWEELSEADKEFGGANTVHFAFPRGDLVFSGRLNFRVEGYDASSVKVAYQIFRTITPY